MMSLEIFQFNIAQLLNFLVHFVYSTVNVIVLLVPFYFIPFDTIRVVPLNLRSQAMCINVLTMKLI